MSDQAASFLERLRRPEYTGENRCLPCTAVNAAIALLVSALVALASVGVAVVVFVGSLLAIYLRGYLVPGTPELTKRHLPESIRDLFGTHPVAERRADEESWDTIEKLEYERANAVDPERYLREVDAVAASDDGDLRLVDDFAARVDRRIDRYRDGSVDREVVADVFDADPDEISFEDREYPAVKIGHRVRSWPSEAAFVTDVATHEALSERTDRWEDVPIEQRRGMLESLRSFHDACPLCSGPVLVAEESVESCCGSYQVATIACEDCGERLLELDASILGSDGG